MTGVQTCALPIFTFVVVNVEASWLLTVCETVGQSRLAASLNVNDYKRDCPIVTVTVSIVTTARHTNMSNNALLHCLLKR